MWYHLIENEIIICASTEREVCVIENEQFRTGQGFIVADSDYYSENHYIYSNGAFAPRTDVSEELKAERRVERTEKFRQTLDRMNNAWYDTLTTQQKTDLATWRQAWLDYPSTGTKPDDLDLFG